MRWIKYLHAWYFYNDLPNECDPPSSKTLLQQGISEPVFYGDLVYKLQKYNMDIMRQYACLVVNQIMVYSSLHDGGSDLRLNDGPDVKL